MDTLFSVEALFSPGSTEIDVELRGVSKSLGGRVVDAVSFAVRRAEFFSLLGPSGCGKTTLLRLISGFEAPDEGAILLGGADVARVPPHRRDVNMVFQSYALFPHLSVAENVAFGLRIQRARDIEARVRRALERVHLAGYERRSPLTLSGGEQQRVALARAIVTGPRVLLLDEPLGALDLKLRKGLREELRLLQRELAMTFVYVTHDQEEALSMSDRVAVMRAGRIEQIGAPRDVYERPAGRFVAEFVGHANFFDGVGDGAVLRTDDGLSIGAPGVRGPATLLVRPEKVRLDGAAGAAPASGTRLRARVLEVLFEGAVTRVILVCGGRRIVAEACVHDGAGIARARPGDEVWVAWAAEDAHVLSREAAP